MTYTIYAGQTKIYDSTDKETYPILSPSADLGMNDAGSMEFTVLPSHPSYNNLKKMKTFITAYRDDAEIFYGRILNSEKGMDGQMTVHCEGARTFFLDSEQTKGEYTETIPEFITRCITAHNAQVETEKQFTVGQMTADKAVEIDPNTGTVVKIKFEIQDYSQTKNVLDSLITQKYGGFFRVRPNSNGPHFLDYVQDYGRTNTQQIKIAENIIDKTDSISGDKIFTILRPLGKNNLTIDSLTQADVTLQNVVKDGEKLKLTDQITEYGSIIRTERFSEIDKPIDLLKAAEEYITRHGTQIPSHCEISFVDWALLNPEVMDVRVGDTFSNIEGFSGVTMTAESQHIDMEDPSNDTITLQNPEELAYNDPASSSGSLSASYASKCTHIDYVYKYIREGDNLLILAAENTEINALRLSALANKIVLTVERDPQHPDDPPYMNFVARDNADDQNPTTLRLSVGNLEFSDGNQQVNLKVNGYATVEALTAVEAFITSLTVGSGYAGTIKVNQVSAGSLSVNGQYHHNSMMTIDGVQVPIVTWGSSYN